MSARTDHRQDAPAWTAGSTVTAGAMKKTQRAPTPSELRFEQRGAKRGLAVGFVMGGVIGAAIGAMTVVVFFSFRVLL